MYLLKARPRSLFKQDLDLLSASYSTLRLAKISRLKSAKCTCAFLVIAIYELEISTVDLIMWLNSFATSKRAYPLETHVKKKLIFQILHSAYLLKII